MHILIIVEFSNDKKKNFDIVYLTNLLRYFRHLLIEKYIIIFLKLVTL